MNITTILSRISTIVEDSSTPILALYQSWVDEAQDEARDGHIFLFNEGEFEHTTVEDQRQLAVKDSTFFKQRGNPYFVDGTGATVEMRYISDPQDIVRRYNEDPTQKGRPRFLHEKELSWDVYPLPDFLAPQPAPPAPQGGDYDVRIPCMVTLPYLAQGTVDNNAYSDQMPLFLIAYAASQAFIYQRDGVEASMWSTKAAYEFGRAKKRDKRNRWGRNQQVRPRFDEYGVAFQESRN